MKSQSNSQSTCNLGPVGRDPLLRAASIRSLHPGGWRAGGWRAPVVGLHAAVHLRSVDCALCGSGSGALRTGGIGSTTYCDEQRVELRTLQVQYAIYTRRHSTKRNSKVDRTVRSSIGSPLMVPLLTLRRVSAPRSTDAWVSIPAPFLARVGTHCPL